MSYFLLTQPDLEAETAKLHRELEDEVLPLGVCLTLTTGHGSKRCEDGSLVWAYA